MKKIKLMALVLFAFSANLQAADGGAILGGAIGGGAGAAIGSELGGKNGAIIGGAIGGATGAAIGSQQKSVEPVAASSKGIAYKEDSREGRHDNGRHLGEHKNKEKRNKNHGHGRGHDD